jgi:Trk K+ transport system NAD-binding subunit
MLRTYFGENIQIFSRAENEEEELKLFAAGVDNILDTNKLVAHDIMGIINPKSSITTIDNLFFKANSLQLVEIEVEKGNPLIGKDINTIQNTETILLGAFTTKKQYIPVTESHIVDEGDILIYIYSIG